MSNTVIKKMKLPFHISGRSSRDRRAVFELCALAAILMLAALCVPARAHAQEDQLNKVHVEPPPPKPEPGPKATLIDGKSGMTARPDAKFRVNVNLVLIPLTVTDPMDRLVTGLEKDNFQIYDEKTLQTIQSFSTEDTPVSIGVIFDMSGSMSDKILRARDSILTFLKTSNPKDEYFVIGFNDRPQLIEDFTSSTEKVEERLANVKAGHRTALLDAIYFGLDKMRQAKYARKALLVVSDGGDNRSRYTEGEVRSLVRESGVQIYAIGIFDPDAPTMEERMGPILLNDIAKSTGGRMFKVDDVSEMGDVATKISQELRNEYVLGYAPSNQNHDGKWRKVKVRLVPPAGLPPLTVHARNGYYAPLH